MILFLVLIKKELTEIFYSRKTLLLFIGVFVFFIYIGTQIVSDQAVDDFYLLAIMSSFCINQFSIDSILSDKRNQILEILFVLNKTGIIFLAKITSVLLLSLVPFITMFVFFMINGHNILPSPAFYIITPLLFWLAACSLMMTAIFFNDEKSASFSAIACLSLILGVIKLLFYFNSLYAPIIGVVFLLLLTIIVTLTAKLVFKNTKIFLKNL
jgi:ABC-type Na+ efflux pump permease subunit